MILTQATKATTLWNSCPNKKQRLSNYQWSSYPSLHELNYSYYQNKFILGDNRRILQGCIFNHLFAKEGDKVWMDTKTWRKLLVVEESSYKFTNFEDCKPRKRPCGVYWCMQSRNWRSSYAIQPRGMLWVQKFEGAWEELCYSWSITCIHSTCSQDVEALLNGKKMWVKDIPLWSEIFVWSANTKCYTI